MKDLLNPENTPHQKVQRINKLPLIMVCLVTLGILVGFFYLINGKNRRTVEAEKNQDVLKTDTSLAEGILKGTPKHGIIGEAYAQQKPVDADQNRPVTLEPAPLAQQPQQKPQKSEAQKEVERITRLKKSRLEDALTAPSTTSTSFANVGNSTGKPTGTVNPAQVANVGGFDGNSVMSKIKDTLETTAGGDPNKQQHKNEFLNEERLSKGYLHNTRTPQVSPYEVKTGTVIPAAMVGGLNSDLPGMIISQITQDVYDTATGAYLLIPQGSKLVGMYDSYVAYGQNRALVAYTKIIYPDGSSIDLGGMPGADQAGYAGLHDQVDNHYFRIFGSALLVSLITGAYEYTQDDNDRFDDSKDAGDTLSSAVAQQLVQTSQGLLRKNLNIQPTIKIRPGDRLNIMVNKDIIFPGTWEG